MADGGDGASWVAAIILTVIGVAGGVLLASWIAGNAAAKASTSSSG